MTTAVQDALIPAPAVLSREESREAVRVAIGWVTFRHMGDVHASWVRPLLPANIAPAQIGATFNALWAKGYLAPAHRAPLLSGGGSGNSNKFLRVWRLLKPIPKDALR